MKWDAVPMEHKMMQKEIDQLVYRVESAIVSVVDPLLDAGGVPEPGIAASSHG